MGWLGKIVGGTIGLALGGPLGAIAGAAFGHAFDTNNETTYMLDSDHTVSDSGRTQLTFFVAAFSMLAKVARADGEVSRAEFASIDNFMTRDLNLSPQSRQAAVNIFNTALNSPQSFQDFAYQFYQEFHDQPQLLELMVDILFRVAVSDGDITPAEENLIHSAGTIFRFNEGTYNTIRSRYVRARKSEKAYTVLGCSPTDSPDQIKRQYRKLVQDYHPDKIAAKGLPEEFIKFAHDKFREIQAAYEEIKAEKGFK